MKLSFRKSCLFKFLDLIVISYFPRKQTYMINKIRLYIVYYKYISYFCTSK